jgi:hypothetical protein
MSSLIPKRRISGGYALFTALVLLVVITTVAVFAMRSSNLELRMASNTALKTESLEASEAGRQLLGEIVDVHAFNRGWPESIGGNIPDALFGVTLPDFVAIEKNLDATLRDWYVDNDETEFNPNDLIVDARVNASLTPDDQTPDYVQQSDIQVFKLRTDLAAGSGAAQLRGYEGTGKGAAASGGNVFFYVQSRGREDTRSTDVTPEAATVTGATYRHVIRN